MTSENLDRWRLLTVTEYWLRRLDDAEERALSLAVAAAIAEGRTRLSATAQGPGQTLGQLAQFGLLGTYHRPLDAAELTRQIVADKQSALFDLCIKHGYASVFAIVGQSHATSLHSDSLAWLVSFLTHALIAEADFYKSKAQARFRSEAGLEKARKKSQTVRSTNAAMLRQAARQMAIDYYSANPFASKADVIAYLRKSDYFEVWKDGTLDRAIDGCQAEAADRQEAVTKREITRRPP